MPASKGGVELEGDPLGAAAPKGRRRRLAAAPEGELTPPDGRLPGASRPSPRIVEASGGGRRFTLTLFWRPDSAGLQMELTKRREWHFVLDGIAGDFGVRRGGEHR